MSTTQENCVNACNAESRNIEEAKQNYILKKPAIRLGESESGYLLQAELPGVKMEDVDVTLEKKILSITALQSYDIPEGFEQVWGHGVLTKYERSFSLPDDIDREHLSASMKDGVLTIVIQKAKSALPAKIEIQAG